MNVTSYVYVRLLPDGTVWRRSFAGRGLAQLEDVREAVAEAGGRGTAIFAHLLMPHRPLEVDERCRPYADMGDRVDYGSSDLSDEAWREQLAQYTAQDTCVHRAVAELIEVIDSVVGRDRSIVIVHGDHGSRFSQHSVAGLAIDEMDQQQLNAQFSTLLAVRLPGMSATVVKDAVPLQDYFRDLLDSGFRQVPARTWRHYVVHAPYEDEPGAVSGDTLRTLRPPDMVWARATPR
jgi:hypothetical protein